jgi:hypothetical protein
MNSIAVDQPVIVWNSVRIRTAGPFQTEIKSIILRPRKLTQIRLVKIGTTLLTYNKHRSYSRMHH